MEFGHPAPTYLGLSSHASTGVRGRSGARTPLRWRWRVPFQTKPNQTLTAPLCVHTHSLLSTKGGICADKCALGPIANMFGARADATALPRCPIAGCGAACTHESPTWWYGFSGTFPELGFDNPPAAPPENPSRKAVLDPRSHAAVKACLSEEIYNDLADEKVIKRIMEMKITQGNVLPREMHAQLLAEGLEISLAQVKKKRQQEFRKMGPGSSEGSEGTNETPRRVSRVPVCAKGEYSARMDAQSRIDAVAAGFSPDAQGWVSAGAPQLIVAYEHCLQGNLQEAAQIHAKLSLRDSTGEPTQEMLENALAVVSSYTRDHVLRCILVATNGLEPPPKKREIKQLDKQYRERGM